MDKSKGETKKKVELGLIEEKRAPGCLIQYPVLKPLRFL